MLLQPPLCDQQGLREPCGHSSIMQIIESLHSPRLSLPKVSQNQTESQQWSSQTLLLHSCSCLTYIGGVSTAPISGDRLLPIE